MEKVKFDLRYKDDILSGKVKVETRDGQAVRIVCYDWCEKYPVIGMILESYEPLLWHADGSFRDVEDGFDLFVVSEKKLKVDVPKMEIGVIICSDKPLKLHGKYKELGKCYYYKCFTDDSFYGVWDMSVLSNMFINEKNFLKNQNPDAVFYSNLYVVLKNANDDILSNRIIRI